MAAEIVQQFGRAVNRDPTIRGAHEHHLHDRRFAALPREQQLPEPLRRRPPPPIEADHHRRAACLRQRADLGGLREGRGQRFLNQERNAGRDAKADEGGVGLRRRSDDGGIDLPRGEELVGSLEGTVGRSRARDQCPPLGPRSSMATRRAPGTAWAPAPQPLGGAPAPIAPPATVGSRRSGGCGCRRSPRRARRRREGPSTSRGVSATAGIDRARGIGRQGLRASRRALHRAAGRCRYRRYAGGVPRRPRPPWHRGRHSAPG